MAGRARPGADVSGLMLVSQAISSLPGGSASYDNGIVRFHQNAEWHHHHHHQAELVGGAYSFVVVFCFVVVIFVSALIAG